jgi:hypothetical protein
MRPGVVLVFGTVLAAAELPTASSSAPRPRATTVVGGRLMRTF